MLDSLRKITHGWLAKAILVAVTVPFALFGIDSYLNNAGNQVAVAKVGGSKISVQEFSTALENAKNYMQNQGQKVDAATLQSPAFKQSVLDGLINRKVLAETVSKQHFTISDEQLSQHIIGMPEFQEQGKFSEDLYQKTLSQNKLTANKFEASVRQDLAVQQVRDGLVNLAFVPDSIARTALATEFEQREVTVADVKAADFIPQVEVKPEQVNAYYQQHKDKFIAPAQVKLEFALLSAAGLVGQVTVSDDEIKQFYNDNAAKFQGDEQRQASHILIGFGVSPTPEAKAKAKQQADEVLAKVKANPKSFAELAKKFSQDPGSAVNGGDLGSFARGAMVKPFEEAAFAMKIGEISNVVESEFGYHIIKLTGITGESSDFNILKTKIKAELIFQKAQQKYAEMTEDFSNTVYEQSASLQPVAKKFNLQLQTSQLMSKEDVSKYFKSDRLAEMLFSDEAIKEKRNSEAVEVSLNNLVSARVVEYKPAAPRSFEDVKSGIEGVLKAEQATKLAKQKGEAMLADLKAGKTVEADWITPVNVDRKNAQGLTDAVMKNVFKVGGKTLPAYYGMEQVNKGYTVIKVSKITNQLTDTPALFDNTKKVYQEALANEISHAYVESLKAAKKIEFNAKVVFGTDQ